MSLIPSRGRPAQPIAFRFIRPLLLEDLMRLAALREVPKVSIHQPKRLREIHHRAAELVASGKTNVDIGRALGLTPQTISDLKTAPAFIDLVSYFEEQITDSVMEARERAEAKLIDGSEMAIDEMNRRIEESPEKVPFGELRQYAAMALDRTILPPKPAAASTPPSMQVTVNLGPRTIAPQETPSVAQSATLMIEHEPESAQ